jgi:lysosomal acid lipase/cholesteryl ester hydrolase
MAFFDHVVQNYGEMGLIGKTRLFVRQSASFGLTLGGLGIVLVLAFASYFNPFKKGPPRARGDREYERRVTGERFSGNPAYYANFWGYRCDEHEIITEGGWILKAHRISDPRRNHAPGYPLILQHGVLCNSSHFFVCEERSMAFWMVDQGFDVWVTNIRANFGSGHTEYTRNDPRFWAYGLKELAFDLRDVIEFITGATGRPRVAYVGHSQGSGSMYLALSPGMCPELGHKISSFTAIGPSVYAGPVLRKFPFSIMRKFRSRKWWSTIFGVKEFIPAISLFQKYLPAFWFGHLGYVIFSYLFGFHDHNWVNRQKPKIFRTLPMPTSSELLYYYMSGFSHRGCIFDPRVQEPWFPSSFPRHSIYYGNLDYFVLGKPLVQRMERNERNVEIVHAVELEGYEHLDFIMGMDAHRVVYAGIKDTIESSISEEERSPEMAERL